MSYQGNYPPSTPLTSSQIAAGAVQPSNLSTGGPYWDGSSNVGIGTTSPLNLLTVQTSATGTTAGSNVIARFQSNASGRDATIQLSDNVANSSTISMVSGATAFRQNGVEAMRIDSSGNVGIGNPYAYNASFINAKISTVLSGTNNPYAAYYYPSSSGEVYVDAITSSSGGTQLVFRTYNNGTYNSSRFDANGTFIVGSSNPSVSSGVGFKADNAGITGCVVNTAVNANTYHFYNVNATNTGYRFYVNVNGGIYNYSANNSNLSDARVKKDIEDAPSYLDKLCSIPVKTFRFKDQDGDWKNLGVIAQEVEAVAPEFVDTDGWEAELPEDGIPLKSIYETDLKYAMLKAIQELKAQNDELKARIATLEAK